MPSGPNGEKRPSDPAACAHHVFKIMVGELPNDTPARKAAGDKAAAPSRSGEESDPMRGPTGTRPEVTNDR